MKKNQLQYLIYLCAFLFALASCRKEEACADMEKGNSASAKIKASEKLVIPAAISLPENAPKGNIRVATYYAEGVQKYKASQKADDPAKLEWVFVAPDAVLFDLHNIKVGTHGAGPYWQLTPADLVYAQQFSPARVSPAPDPESIDWLLLKIKAGTTPSGAFAGVDYIQRIATKGGKAPQTPPQKITDTIAVKYQAVYRFSKMVL